MIKYYPVSETRCWCCMRVVPADSVMELVICTVAGGGVSPQFMCCNCVPQQSKKCAFCGTMDTRVSSLNGELVCRPCQSIYVHCNKVWGIDSEKTEQSPESKGNP